jgi:hypothetical protein
MYRNTTLTPLTTSAWTVYPYDTVLFDPNVDLTTGAGAAYTCPVDGYYAVSGSWSTSASLADGTETGAAILQTGSYNGRVMRGTVTTAGAASPISASVSAPCIACLAGDTLQIEYFTTASGTNASALGLEFSAAYFSFVAPR